MRYAVLIAVVLIILAGVFFYGRKLSHDDLNTTQPASYSTLPNQSSTNGNISQGPVPKINFKLTAGFTIHTFAQNLGTARDLQFSPGGVLLVSVPTNGTVIALPDINHDGVADSQKVVITDGHHLHGLAFYNNKLYVAEVDRVVRYNWNENNLSANLDKVLFTLPSNNDHNSRTITFDGSGKMFVSVGSTCNVCNESSEVSATVITADSDGGNVHVFAKGLRNAPFIQFNPTTSQLWGTEMGRDNLGDNIPPDEINIIKEGGDYGWPNCYADKIPDKTFNANADCQNTVAPIFQIPAHSAPLGWSFINSDQFPRDWQGDMLVSYHGSWNRSTPIGYKVVHLKVAGNSILSSEDFLTGFLPSGALVGPVQAQGRPVDLTFDKNGNLYLSDDKSGSVYIIQKQ